VAGVECIDFDLCGAAWPAWRELVETNAPGLIEQLYIERSPSGGRHVLYRCAAPEGNQKLTEWWLPIAPGTTVFPADRCGAQLLCRGFDALEVHRRLGLGIAPRHVGQADDGVQRRADLVVHVGEELALGTGCGLGPVAQAQLDEAMTAADDYAAALGEPDRISQSLKDYDLDIKRAEEYAKALRAGAACGLA
jgi:hypothetical protein